MVDVDICWQKLDRKSKKVNFLISHGNAQLDEKADASTIEAVSENIEALQFKLDEISMNIVSQVETEKVHFERKSATHSPHLTRLRFCSSYPRHRQLTDLDERLKNAPRASGLRRAGIHDDIVL